MCSIEVVTSAYIYKVTCNYMLCCVDNEQKVVHACQQNISYQIVRLTIPSTDMYMNVSIASHIAHQPLT